MFTVYMPHQNLACLGLRVSNPWDDSQLVYADLYFNWEGLAMMRRPYVYVNIRGLSRFTLGLFFVRHWR